MSKLEAMAYKMQPAGHEKPQDKRKYEKPDSRLAKGFEKWLKKISFTPCDESEEYNEQNDEWCKKALAIIKPLNPSITDAHALLVHYQDHPKISDAGLFITTIYNQSPERDIILDLKLDTPITAIGYKLAEGKRFINYDNLNSEICSWSKSPAINYGKMIDFGEDSSALLINLGSTVTIGVSSEDDSAPSPVIINFGKCAGVISGSDGTIISLNDPTVPDPYDEEYPRFNPKYLLKAEDCRKTPQLAAYLERLKQKFEAGRNDYTKALAALDELGEEPGKNIEQDLEKLLWRKP